MASRIAGITIEIGGDTTKLQKALKGVDSQLKTTQNNLRDIDKLLKLNPGSVELLTQKQKNLTQAIGLTNTRLEELKKAQSGVEEGSAEWDAIQREIVATENDLKNLQKELRNFGSVTSQKMKAAGEAVKQAGAKIESVGQKLKGISASATAIGGAMLKLGYDAVTSADELNTLSKQTGISVEELQKMQYAAELVDVSVEDMTGAMRKLKTKITPTNETLKKLGISATNADGSLRDANDVFYDALKALSGISNETERDQVAMELFGKSADSLAGIIDDGGAALKEYGKQAENLGLILDEDTIDALNETNDKIDQIKGTVRATMAQVGADVASVLAPVIEKAAALIGKVTERLRELGPEQTETILKIVGVVAALAPALIVIGKLVSGIGSVISVIGTVVGFLGGPLTIAIAAVIAIGILLYKNWDKIKATALAMKERVEAAWDNMKEKINSVVETIKAKIDGFKEKIDSLRQKFEDLKDKVFGVWETIKGILQGNITLPHIPLPHFYISPPGWKIGDLLKGSIPSLGIEWYAKAYDNPVMFTQPTVMATPNGYKGFGDGAGAEIVMGLNKLRELVGSYGSEPIYINTRVILDGKVVGESVSKYQRDMARARG